jgi:hypothetical protein
MLPQKQTITVATASQFECTNSNFSGTPLPPTRQIVNVCIVPPLPQMTILQLHEPMFLKHLSGVLVLPSHDEKRELMVR